MHEIISVFLKISVQSVCLYHSHVAQPALGDFGTRHLHEARLSFKSHYRSVRSNALRQQIENSNRTAADIDRTPSRLNPDLVQKPIGLRFVNLGLCEQALQFSLRTA